MTQTQETPLIFLIIIGVEPDTRGGDPMTKAQHQPLFDLRRSAAFVELCVLGLVDDEEVVLVVHNHNTAFEIPQGDRIVR